MTQGKNDMPIQKKKEKIMKEKLRKRGKPGKCGGVMRKTACDGYETC